MKAVSKFLSAASAVALSAAWLCRRAVAVQFAYRFSGPGGGCQPYRSQGNQRVDAETIRSYLDIKPGKSFSAADIDEAVKRLFATGLFSDVRVNQVGSTLVVQVAEYQVVNQVLFQGNKKIKDAELASAVQLKPRGTFSPDALEADAEAIREAYRRDRTRRRDGHDADHGSRRKPRERRLRDQRRRPHQDRRRSISSATTPSATAACRMSSRPSARRSCPSPARRHL